MWCRSAGAGGRSRPARPWAKAPQSPFYSSKAECQHHRLSRPHQPVQGQKRKSAFTLNVSNNTLKLNCKGFAWAAFLTFTSHKAPRSPIWIRGTWHIRTAWWQRLPHGQALSKDKPSHQRSTRETLQAHLPGFSSRSAKTTSVWVAHGTLGWCPSMELALPPVAHFQDTHNSKASTASLST